MFGSSRREAETLFRRQATKAWRRVSGAYRQTMLRAAMFLQGASVDAETLAVTLDGERQQIMRTWTQLAISSTGSIRDAGPLSELAAAVELCLSRLLEALSALPADQIDAPILDRSQFAFARTLAEFGRREGVPFDQLLADLLLLREALLVHLYRYPLAARVARALIHTFLDQAAVALAREWSALGEEIATRDAEQASSLLTISGEMLATLDPAAGYQAVVSSAQQALRADMAALLLLTPGGDSLELVAVAGESDELQPENHLPLEGSVSGRAISSGRPFTCLDTAAGGLRPVGSRRLPAGTPATSAVSAPVGAAGEPVGALEVCTTARRIFEPHEADRLAILAGQAGLIRDNADLQLRAREQERAGALREIDLARRVQASLLGRNALEVGPFRLGARLDPSREVGGDYYDLFTLDGDRAAIHVGDVSGKGIPAALLVAMARYSLRAHATTAGASPAGVLRETNALFSADLGGDMVMFVTACYAILEPEPLRLIYAAAGHPAPMIRRGNVVQVSTAQRQAPPLGLAEGPEFHDREVLLAPGDVLAFYTDGVVEARNSLGAWFGLSGLERILRTHGDREPDEIATAVVDAVVAHMGGQPLSDDTTVVILKVAG
jgi:serine phosphatase RsbU (regulator of sigma subunit)